MTAGRWVRALLAGLVVGFRTVGQRRAGARTALVAVATALLALSSMAVLAVGATYDGILARNADRAPRDAEVFPHEPVHALYDPVVVADPTGTATIVRLLPPPGSSAFSGLPPPGLPRWPAPGEVWLSPTLAAGQQVGATTPWGRLAGHVAPAGLSTPTERIGYTQTGTRAATAGYFPVTGFGVPDAQRALQVGDVHRNASRSYLTALTSFFLVVPGLVLAFLTARGETRRRQRQTLVLQALGVPPPALGSVVVGEIAPAAVLGSAVALAVGLVASRQPMLPLPGTQVVLTGTDLAHSTGGLVAASALAVVVVLASALAALRRADRLDAPRLSVATERSRRPVLLVAVVATSVLFLSAGLGLPPLVRITVLVVSVASTLWVLPLVVSAIVTVVSTAVSRPGTRHGLLLVVGRQSAARPRSVERVALGMVMMIGIAGIGQLYFSAASPPALDAERLESTLRGSVMEMPLQGRAPSDVGGVLDQLPPDTVTVSVRQDPGGHGSLAITCADLAVLGHDCTTVGATVPAAALGPRFLAVGRWYGDASPQPTVTVVHGAEPPGDVTTLLLVQVRGLPLPHDRLAAAAFQEGLRADALGETWVVGARLFAYQARWVAVLAGAGLCLVVSALAVGASSQLTATARDVAPVLLLAGRRRSAWVIAAWHQLLPLVLGLLVGLCYYAVMSVYFSYASQGQASSTFVGVCLVGGVAGSLVTWGIASLRLVSGSVRDRQWLEV